MGRRESCAPEDLGVEYLLAMTVALAQDATTNSTNTTTCALDYLPSCEGAGQTSPQLHTEIQPSTLLSAMFTEASSTFQLQQASLVQIYMLPFRTPLVHQF